MIEFQCESCGHTTNVKDEYAGKKAYCPKCKVIGKISMPSAEVELTLAPESLPSQSTASAKPPTGNMPNEVAVPQSEERRSVNATAPKERRLIIFSLAALVIFVISIPLIHWIAEKDNVVSKIFLTIDLNQVWKDHQDNPVRARNKWIGDDVSVTGRVSEIGYTRVSLFIPSAGYNGYTIDGDIAKAGQDKIESLTIGQQVTLCGTVSNVSENSVSLDDCIIKVPVP